MIVEILEGLTRDALTSELSALRAALRESEADVASQRVMANSLSDVCNKLRGELDRLRILNESLEKENSTLRFEVERLEKRVEELAACWRT